VALTKARALRRAAIDGRDSLAARHDLEIACDPALGAEEVLSAASAVFSRLGIKTRRRSDVLSAVSRPWSVWGSPIFHWALLALIVALVAGNLWRTEGLMGLAVGQTKADAPDSYGFLATGPLHGWGGARRSIRVDAFEPDFTSGGIDRGPTPTVSVLDAAGAVLKTQRVYPNMTLSVGSLTVYPSDFGLSATVSAVTTSGVETGRGMQLIDFSTEATGGTVPVDYVSVFGHSKAELYRVYLSVPLDRTGGAPVRKVPVDPTVRAVVKTLDGTTVLDGIMRPGQAISLAGADALRLDGVGYYARLQIVDDWSIPFLYAGVILALLGLTATVVARQQIVLATAIEGPGGVKLAVTLRLWRNASSSRSEIESELARALGGIEKGSAT
jgi:cytochrome c biogenesis protein ResB